MAGHSDPVGSLRCFAEEEVLLKRTWVGGREGKGHARQQHVERDVGQGTAKSLVQWQHWLGEWRSLGAGR